MKRLLTLALIILILSPFISEGQRRFRYLPQNPELGINIPSFIERTADLRLVIFPNYPFSFTFNGGYMYNNQLKGSFEKVEDGTRNWNNSGWYIAAGGRINFLQIFQPTDYFFSVKYLTGYFNQSCDYTNPMNNNSYALTATGLFYAFCFEGGMRYRVRNSFSLDFGIQCSMPYNLSSKMASETFSVLPGVGSVTVGSTPKLLLIISPKIYL